MRILWILPYSPLPATSGGKTRQYNLLRELAGRGHRITLLMQTKNPLDAQDRAQLESFLDRLIVTQRRPLRSAKTLAAALLAPYPMLASINGLSPRLSAIFEELLDEQWDVIQIEHSYTFQPYEKALLRRKKPFILSEHNVESALGSASSQRLPAPLRPLAAFDRWRYRRWERRVLPRAAKVIAVTESDAAQLAAIAGRAVAVVVNGVNCAAFAGNTPDVTSGRMLFVGNYEYAPNIDAVRWAVEEIMPEVWRRNADVRLCICGYAMPPQWAERWPDPRLEWRGFVADLGELQRSSLLFLAPLRHGGGSKLKVLEAMAAGLPVVSTSQGVSGLNIEKGVSYLGGETPAALAEAAAALFDDSARALAIGNAGRRYVQTNHDWEAAAQQLEAVYRTLAPRQT